MPAQRQVSFALRFPEGLFLMINGSPYYMQEGADKAYSTYGSRNQLLGKFHHQMQTRSEVFDKYDLTYEIEDDQLIAARLITPFSRSAGELINNAAVANLNEKLESGQLELVQKKNDAYICRAAKFGDGRMLLLIDGMEEDNRHTLLVGEPGTWERIEIHNGVQGGNSFYYTTNDGKSVALPYGLGGPRHNEPPQFGDEYLAYIENYDQHDFAAFGIAPEEKAPHLDPFCPEIAGPLPR